MIKLIIGEKGKGKTKILLEKANTEIKSVEGNVVYLDKNKQHMYELNNKVRLIDVTGFLLDNTDQFLGFLSGIISQDSDLEQVYLDSFLTIANTDAASIQAALDKINDLSKTFNIDFFISASVTADQVPEYYKGAVIASL